MKSILVIKSPTNQVVGEIWTTLNKYWIFKVMLSLVMNNNTKRKGDNLRLFLLMLCTL